MVELEPWVLIAVNAGAWVAWSFAVGWWSVRRPLPSLRTGPITRLRRWEHGGKWYRRALRVHRWKDHLPEAGELLGGLGKRHLPSVEQGGLARFGLECLRAEQAHLVQVAILPVFVLWNPPIGMVVNTVYALAANLPCVLAVRYNRARVEAVLARRGAR